MAAPLRTAKKLLLGRELDRMIGTAGVTHAAAAALIDVSQAKITGLIGGQGAISKGDLQLLASKLGFTEQGYLDQLEVLRRDSHRRGYWSTGFRRAFHEDFRLMVDLEQHASMLRVYEVEIYPGLLQSEPYIRWLVQSDPELDDQTVEDRVAARLYRQEILFKRSRPFLHVVMSESCIRAEYAPPEIMAAQARHVEELSRRDDVVVQIVPFKKRPDNSTRNDSPGSKRYRSRYSAHGKFVLVEVPSPGVAGPLKMAYVENPAEIRYLDAPGALSTYDRTWSLLTTSALDRHESRSMLLDAAGSY